MEEAPTIRTVCATLMDMSRRFLLGELKKGGLVTELRQLASHLEGGADDTEGAAAAAKELHAQWLQVFGYWQRQLGKERARPTAERRTKVLARLRDGYTVADIKRAIDGVAASDFHTEGGYNDLTLICRNGAKLEEYADKMGGVTSQLTSGKAAAAEADADDAERELAAEMEAALASGDTATYNDIQKTLAEARAARRKRR